MGGWTRDQKLAEVGRYVQLGFENDLEGKQTFSSFCQHREDLLTAYQDMQRWCGT